MLIEERIREWQQNFLSEHCRVCSDTCCNSKKHAILFDDSSLPLFQERGIPIVRVNQLEEPFLIEEGLYLKDGSEVGKPSIVEPPKGLFRRKWFIYSDICPFYSKEKGCDVHEDPRRPEVCKKYPIVFLECTDTEGRFFDIRIKDCEYSEEIRKEITKEFPVKVIN